MQNYIESIEHFWNNRNEILSLEKKSELQNILNEIILKLQKGEIRVSEKRNDTWVVNHWIKKSILLYFMTNEKKIFASEQFSWYDKIAPRFDGSYNKEKFDFEQIRLAPGAFVREGSYIGKNVILMPSFVNIGAYIDDKTMIDTWATIGSCAQIGKNCHISGGTGIGGVLEPIQNNPVIIEDDCFIGARSEIAEGVIVGRGSVISMGVFISSSTKIFDRESGETIYGRVPPYSVVVPGNIQQKSNQPSLYCAVIVKKIDHNTRRKTAINDLLRI